MRQKLRKKSLRLKNVLTFDRQLWNGKTATSGGEASPSSFVLFQKQVPDLANVQVVLFDNVLPRLRWESMRVVRRPGKHVISGLHRSVRFEKGDIAGVGVPSCSLTLRFWVTIL
jgi:hypothetical protein